MAVREQDVMGDESIICSGCGQSLLGVHLDKVRPLASGDWVHYSGDLECLKILLGRVSSVEEQLPCKQKVEGSNPSPGTKRKKRQDERQASLI